MRDTFAALLFQLDGSLSCALVLLAIGINTD
jgi:hypothetical protein